MLELNARGAVSPSNMAPSQSVIITPVGLTWRSYKIPATTGKDNQKRRENTRTGREAANSQLV